MNTPASGDARTPAPAQPGLLRSLNNRVVLDLLIEHGTLSRSDVHTLTGLSKPTASQLLQRLEESGLVRPSGFGETGPGGRAPQLYRINPAAGHAAAVDVRRGLVRVRISDITGTVVVADERETDAATSGPAHVAALLRACCAEAGLAPTQIDSIAVSAPGSYDIASDTLSYVDHLPGWQHPNVGAELREAFPSAAVSLENDVNLAAVAEQHAADDNTNFFLFWLDDGIGGAIMIDGSLYRGSRGAAGEAAFMLVPGTALDEASRTEGALERLVGTDSLCELAAAAGHEAHTAAQAMHAILADPGAADAFREISRRYALALASVIALLDPERIVLAGELARGGGERLRAEIARQLDTLVLAAPPIVGTVASETPILDGAMLQSLGVARDRVFTT